MKKIFSLFLTLMAAISLWAYDFQSGDLYYNITSDTTVEVTCQLTSYPYNEGVTFTTVTIPETVIYNGTTYIVTSIGDRAFRNCSSLTSMVVEGNTTYDSRDNCNAIIETATNTLIAGCQNTIIPNSVTSIGMFAFYECSSLTSVTIPNSVTSIGDYAFLHCRSLTSITIPNSVTSIGEWAFYACTFAKDKFINNSSLDAEANDYWGATIVDQDIDGLLIQNDTVIGYRGHKDTIVIPDGVLAIADDVFRSNSKIKSVTIPKSVTSIGKLAFDRCSALTSITIPESVTTIGNNAFEYCTNLTSIVWNPISCTGFWTEETTYCIFYGCENVTSVTFGDKVAEIPRCLCEGMHKLTSITIPNSVTSIGDWVFWGCSSLTSITIPNSVTSIGYAAFAYCSGLTSVTIPNSVTSIGYRAFRSCSSLTSVTLGNNVTSIGNNAFGSCNKIQEVTAYMPTPIDAKDCGINPAAATLYVPAEYIDTYSNTLWWEDFKEIRAITTTAAPEVFVNPTNPTQKLLRNGQVYILHEEKMYTITGQRF